MIGAAYVSNLTHILVRNIYNLIYFSLVHVLT